MMNTDYSILEKFNQDNVVVEKLDDLKYNPELAQYFDIGTFNMAVAGNRMCQKIQLAQIKLALVKRSEMSMLEDIVNIGINRETKLQLQQLQKEIDELGEDQVEEKRSKMDEKYALLNSEMEALNEDEVEIKEEQRKLWSGAMAKSAANWALLAAASKDFADIVEEASEALESTKSALDDAKDGGFKGLKDVAKITVNLKAIPQAGKIGVEIVKGVGRQFKLYGKLAKAMKKHKYEVPTIEEASADAEEFDASGVIGE